MWLRRPAARVRRVRVSLIVQLAVAGPVRRSSSLARLAESGEARPWSSGAKARTSCSPRAERTYWRKSRAKCGLAEERRLLLRQTFPKLVISSDWRRLRFGVLVGLTCGSIMPGLEWSARFGTRPSR